MGIAAAELLEEIQQWKQLGSNLRAIHNLAHNIAKTIKESSWSGSGQPTAILTGGL
jgi:hypothetical protein